MIRRGNLRLIAFDPEELQSGELLLKATGDQIGDPIEIGSVFSLIFTWQNQSRCYLQRKGPQQKAIEIKFESPGVISEIDFLHFDIKQSQTDFFLRGGDLVTFFVEIFQTSYRFDAEIFEVKSADKPGARYAIAPPHELFVQKLRRLPRVWLEEEDRISGRLETQAVELVEIGADSMVARPQEGADFTFEKGTEIHYELNGYAGKATFLRKSGDDLVLLPKADFFEFYRSVRYPQFAGQDLGLHVLASRENRERWATVWKTDPEEPGSRILLQVESLLTRKSELDLYVIYPLEDAFATRLWSKFCQESKSHRLEYPRSFADSEAADVVFAGAPLGSPEKFRFVKLSQKDLLHLYSSVEHLKALITEMKRKNTKRRTG